MAAADLRFSRNDPTDARLLSLLTTLTVARDFVTGENLAARLGVSRTAVWKSIRVLTDQGYAIEAKPRQGYRFLGAPDRLLPLELARLAPPETLTRVILWYGQTGSTNAALHGLGQAGWPEGSLAIAEEQTAGRGRLGRSWTAPAGSALLFSLLLRPALSMPDSFTLTMLAAIAVAEGIESLTGLRATIKWPNDVLINDRKVAGILSEVDGEMERLRFAIIGVGINVNFNTADFAPDIPGTATSIKTELGHSINRLALLRETLGCFDRRYQVLSKGDLAGVRNAWRARLSTIGRPVSVTTLQGREQGIAEETDEQGALLLRRPDGSLVRVLTGDVTLRT
jgi:BirA family transcriptional regulator, biotin operon repressor / biotin---[acetyl-CoA-carboxylase] ligase